MISHQNRDLMERVVGAVHFALQPWEMELLLNAARVDGAPIAPTVILQTFSDAEEAI